LLVVEVVELGIHLAKEVQEVAVQEVTEQAQD
jgi:hypothetical protein